MRWGRGRGAYSSACGGIGPVAWRVVREPIWEWGCDVGGAAGAARARSHHGTAARTPTASSRSLHTTSRRGEVGCGCFVPRRKPSHHTARDARGRARWRLGWVGVRLPLTKRPFSSARERRTWTLRREISPVSRRGRVELGLVELAQTTKRRALRADGADRPGAREVRTPGTASAALGSGRYRGLLAGWGKRREVARGQLAPPTTWAKLELPPARTGSYRLIADTRVHPGKPRRSNTLS